MQYRIVITRCCLLGVGWDCAVISVHHATYHVSLISRLPSKRWIARWSSCFDQARGTHMPTSLRGGEGGIKTVNFDSVCLVREKACELHVKNISWSREKIRGKLCEQLRNKTP